MCVLALCYMVTPQQWSKLATKTTLVRFVDDDDLPIDNWVETQIEGCLPYR